SHADLAVVTNDAAAERRADIWLQDLWAGRESAGFALPVSRLALACGDVVGLTVGGRRRLMEVRSITDAEARAVKARSIEPAVFDVPLRSPRRISFHRPLAVGPVTALALDLPTLTADEPPILLRLAVFANPWPGPVAIWRSFDGTTFERIAVALAPAIVGETLDDLPAGPTSRWDWASSVRVRLSGGALVAATDTQVLNGANAAVLRRPDGSWEVIQFANAELVAERTYELSRLLRGQMGSEQAMGAPLPAGAPFVLLDSHVTPIARGLPSLGRPMKLRVVAADRNHGDPAAVAFDVTPQTTALRPLAPVHIAARRSGERIMLTWTRRKRGVMPASWDVAVPLGEDSERYAVDILSGAAVVRTLQAAAPSALYAAADEISDFGSAQATLSVRVHQLSASVGRGFAAEATLTL
ncbi:MAG: phage tail baseplate protein, partial [Xanthobacteraceae bacterium]